MSFIDYYTAWSVHYFLIGHGFKYYTYYGYGWTVDRCQN